jgi:hypothetical protein
MYIMNANPIVEKQQQDEAERRAKAAFRYPYQIICVYLPEDGYDFPIFHDVKKYCSENNLSFLARPYDHEKYEEDMYVKRLLAFHIMYKKYHQETHYYDTDPIHKIQIVVWAYQDEEKAKARARQKRQERWDSLVEGFQSIFSLERFKKKPALDREASQKQERFTSNG